jgi:hypothetical protein
MRPEMMSGSRVESVCTADSAGDLRTEGELLRSTEQELYTINTHAIRLHYASLRRLVYERCEPSLELRPISPLLSSSRDAYGKLS